MELRRRLDKLERAAAMLRGGNGDDPQRRAREFDRADFARRITAIFIRHVRPALPSRKPASGQPPLASAVLGAGIISKGKIPW